MSKHRTEDVCLVNMCIVEDEEGNVVALDKVKSSYRGKTFPGGHIEKGEPFEDAIIREVWEETGLKIENPKLCGIYHWEKDSIHFIMPVYHATEFSGELTSSEEGKVYWIPLEEFKDMDLATGTEYVIEIVENKKINECVMRPSEGTYRGTLY